MQTERDIQTEKLKLIEWLAGLNDSDTLQKIIHLKQANDADWWETISKEERSEIEEGIAQADRGELTPHADVMAKYNKWR